MKTLRVIAVTVGILGSATFVAGVVGAQAASAAPARLKCQTMQSSDLTDLFSPILLGECNHPGTSGGSGTTSAEGSGPYPVVYLTGKQTNFAEDTGIFRVPRAMPIWGLGV